MWQRTSFCPTQAVFCSQPCPLGKMGRLFSNHRVEFGHYLIAAKTLSNGDSSFLSVLGTGQVSAQEGFAGVTGWPLSPPPSYRPSSAHLCKPHVTALPTPLQSCLATASLSSWRQALPSEACNCPPRPWTCVLCLKGAASRLCTPATNFFCQFVQRGSPSSSIMLTKPLRSFPQARVWSSLGTLSVNCFFLLETYFLVSLCALFVV